MLSLLSRIIFIIIVSGTDRSIPTGPNTHPQKINYTNTTKLDNPNPLPKILTSRIEPYIVLAIKKPTAVKIALPALNCISAKIIGGTDASN